MPGRLRAFLVVFVVSLFIFSAQAQQPIAITHVTVVNRHGVPSQADETIVIAGERVLAEGAAAKIRVPKNAQVVDGKGKFLIPGLWDMHVHIAGVTADPTWSKQVLLPLLLAYGIVGVRDMGGDLPSLLAWQREERVGSLLAPAIVASGPFLVSSGKKTRDQIPVTTVDEARVAVREIKASGANFVKIISLPSREVFFAVADEAHKQNIPLVGHLPFEVGALEASNAGMRGIEHLFYSGLSLSLSSEEESLRPQLVAAVAKRDHDAWEAILRKAESTYSPEKATALAQAFQKNGTWLTPTLGAMVIATNPNEWKEDDPNLVFVPPALAAEFRSNVNDEAAKRRTLWLARQSANDPQLTAKLFRAGVPILAGSDSLDPFDFPGSSLHRELAELVRAGLTPLQALQSATTVPAEFLRNGGALDSANSYADASFVLLDADPLVDITNTRKISAVIHRGQFLHRAKLDAMLAAAQAAAAVAK